MAQHLDLGRKGESLAKTFLEGFGLRNTGRELDENWTHGKAEIDLVVYEDKMIIFAEVKTRTGDGFAEPEDFVDTRKKRLLAEAADEYIYLMDYQCKVRFDIISVLFDRNDNYTLKHIEDAFWPSSD